MLIRISNTTLAALQDGGHVLDACDSDGNTSRVDATAERWREIADVLDGLAGDRRVVRCCRSSAAVIRQALIGAQSDDLVEVLSTKQLSRHPTSDPFDYVQRDININCVVITGGTGSGLEKLLTGRATLVMGSPEPPVEE